MPPKSKKTGLNTAGTRAKGSSVSHRGPGEAGRRAATLRAKSRKARVAQDGARARHSEAIASVNAATVGDDPPVVAAEQGAREAEDASVAAAVASLGELSVDTVASAVAPLTVEPGAGGNAPPVGDAEVSGSISSVEAPGNVSPIVSDSGSEGSSGISSSSDRGSESSSDCGDGDGDSVGEIAGAAKAPVDIEGEADVRGNVQVSAEENVSPETAEATGQDARNEDVVMEEVSQNEDIPTPSGSTHAAPGGEDQRERERADAWELLQLVREVNAREADESNQLAVTESAGGEARPLRAAAERATVLIAGQAFVDLNSQRNRRKRRGESVYGTEDLEEQAEEDHRVDDVGEVRSIVEREMRDGARWYRVRWKEFGEGKPEYQWLPEEGVAGAPAWKSVVDRYYDEVLPKSPELLFTHYFDQDCDVSTMSTNKDFDCVYTALAKIMELQGSEMRVTQEIVARFEAREGFDRIAQKGLRSDQVQRFIECLVSEGWRCRVEKSQYKGGPTGPAGLALAAAGPGLFFVGTLERPRIGHCIVLEITEEKACFVHEAGVKIRLGQYNYANQICWVRRCTITNGPGEVGVSGVVGEEEPEEEVSRAINIQIKKKSRRKRAKRVRT